MSRVDLVSGVQSERVARRLWPQLPPRDEHAEKVAHEAALPAGSTHVNSTMEGEI
jgi:hypothetical protein